MKSRDIVFLFFIATFTLMSFEGMFFIAGKLLQSKWAMWKPPGEPPVVKKVLSYEQYLGQRDPVLGWPYLMQYGEVLDVNGAHRNPHFPNGYKEASCVSLYGDSFTEAVDASSSEKTWGNLLSSQLHCYVANFGMSGYGTDQAYLRFARNHNDSSPVVIFGLHTADVQRNLTRIRDLQSYNQWYALKPRFILNDQNEIELVPIPVLTEQEYLRAVGLADDPLILEHESFHPGGAAGAVKLEFPYMISVIKNMMYFSDFHSKILRHPVWMEYLQRGHPLHGLEITVGITRKFVELARQRRKATFVVILPHIEDFKYFERNGRWPYQTLMEEYTRHSIPFIDFGPYLISIAQKRGKPIKEYFGPTWHYNDEGYALVASFVYNHVKANAPTLEKR